MPESSFFNPIGMPPGGPSTTNPQLQADPNFRAGYRNIYGTNMGASVSPVTRQGSIDFKVPLGDHQRQQFLTGDAYYRPEGGGAPADYGFKVGLSKKIAPRGLSGGELINRVLERNLNAAGQPAVVNAGIRSQLMETFTPEQLRILGQEAKQINRQQIDEQLGIVPGAEKYRFDLGVDVGQKPQFSPEFQNSTPGAIPGAIQFAKDYANKLTNEEEKSDNTFTNPNMSRRPRNNF